MTELRLRRPEEGWLSLALVVVMMIVLASAIDDPAYVNGRGNLTDGLVWFALLGVAFGFIGPKVGWSRWTTHGIGALFAGLLIPILAGMAIAPGSSVGGAFDASAQGIVKAYFDTVWIGNEFTTVQVHYVIAFGAIVWAAGQFAAYAVFGHRRPLNAVIMAGIVLLVNMSITFNAQLPYLVVFSGAALFLLIEMHAFDERATWVRRRIGDPATISSLYLRGGTVFILAAMVGSLLLTTRAASSPLAGAWRPVHDQLAEVGETIGRLLPVGGNLRGGGVSFGPIAKIGAQWFNNNDEVFSAVVPAVPKDEPLYWRAVTFNQFVLGAWINSPGTTQDVDAGAPLLDGTEEAPDPDLTHTIKVTVRPDNFSDNKLLTPGLPTDVSAGAVVNLTGPDGWFQGADVQGDPSEYTVDAQVMREGDTAVISGNRLAAASTAYPTDVAALYTDVPQGAMGPEANQLLATIKQMAGGSTNPYILASTMEKYLSTGPFHYSTDLTNLPNTDPSAVENFAATKTGYCLHFASTMAILLRAANPENRIPTRLVEGFLPSDPVGGVVTITARAAHAWVEVYFPGYGWIRFDPTGGNIGTKPSEIKPGPSFKPPPSSVGPNDNRPDPPARPSLNLGNGVPATAPGSNQIGNRVVFAVFAVLLALLIGVLAFAAWLRGPRGEMNPDRAWLSMAKAASRLGFGPRPNQTIYEYATSLGELVPVARADLATVADAKVETAYARVRLGGDRMSEVGAAARRLRFSLLRLVFRRSSRRKRRH